MVCNYDTLNRRRVAKNQAGALFLNSEKISIH